MPAIPTRRQQPSPVNPQVPIPGEFPAIPQEVLDRFPSAKDWQTRLNEFWQRTAQALQVAQQQSAAQINSTVIWTVDRFLIYTNDGSSMPMFVLDSTGIRLGNVLVVNTPGRKVYIGAGEYANDNTPFYIDTLGFFSLGASLTWDPETDTLTITGIINATSGTIGGFEIGADYIRDTVNTFGLASTVTAGNDVRFWAGSAFAGRATAPFRVYEDGTSYIEAGVFDHVSILGSVAPNGASLSIAGIPTGSGVGIYMTSGMTADSNGDTYYTQQLIPNIGKSTYTGLTTYGYYVRLNSATGTGTIDNAYGVYIDTVNIATNNWGLYVATTARNYMAGDLTAASIGSTTPGSGAFTTLSATTADDVYGLKVAGATGKIRISGYFSGISYLDAVNAAESAYGALTLRGSTVTLAPGGTTAGVFSSTGLAVTGVVDINGTAASATAGHLQLGSSTQTTIGANGAASALTANPLGYFSAYLGATHIIIPYYNA